MNAINVTPDSIVYWRHGFININATLVNTWIVMAVLIVVSWLATRKLSTGPKITKLQNFLEALVSLIRKQTRDMMQQDPDKYIPFIGTLFLFISISNLLSLVPFYRSPAGSLSTTSALAICVFIAVPFFGIVKKGVLSYFKHYIQPAVFMLPFNIMGEISRTLALAVRLFGNVMSGAMIAAILLIIVPIFLPVILQALDLIIGQIQAFIFAALSTIYIASATRVYEEKDKTRVSRKQNNE